MMLHKKWIILTILSTCLWSDNNETNTTHETGIFESISNFFGTNETDANSSDESNISTDVNSSNVVQTNTANKSTKKDIPTDNNETNTSNETGIFDSIGAFFAGAENNTSRHDENNESNASTIKISIDVNKKENNISHKPKNNPSYKINSDMSQFNGAWHLRVLDGMEVRKARAIVDFTFNDKQSKFSGFDSCNRIIGTLKATSDTTLSIPAISSTRMACRGKIHRWVSKRVQKTLGENFSIKEEEKHGLKGITIKSPTHELFFKRMQRD